jgi:hypothetical protein
MVLKKWPVLAVLGAAFSLAVPLTAGPALAQTAPTRSLVITSPAAGATVPSPFTVSITLVSSSGGAAMAGNHHHGEAVLVIDVPAPVPGDMITPDADHIVFPPGQTQLSVSLPPGQHHLQIVAATHKGKVTYKVQPSAPLTVTVQ